MPSELQGTVTHSHDPKPPELPPLPEAVLFTLNAGDNHWSATWGTTSLMDKLKANMNAREGVSTRIITIQPPPSAREVSDAEVAKIIRDAGVAYPNWTDSEMLHNFDLTARCVRAALTKGASNGK